MISSLTNFIQFTKNYSLFIRGKVMDIASKKIHIRKAAVLGSGVMGAQIAAHLLNAGITTILFDLSSKEQEKSALAINAIANLKKLKPAPIDDIKLLDTMQPANYEEDLPRLLECDLIIETIAECMEWKLALYQQIADFLPKNIIFATNTSGLSINTLAQALPANIQPRFLGIHFFNPPRYMTLIELIPHKNTDLKLMGQVEEFIVSHLGKGVVPCKDTPNFIGNRVGMFAILAVIYHAERLGISPDIVDLLTGPAIGRPKSATFRTLDIVGLDTFAHVVDTMTSGLPEDPWHKFYQITPWIKELIAKKFLGQKTKIGIFKRVNTENYVFDLKQNDYRPAITKLSPEITAILQEKNLTTKFTKLKESALPEAQFLWACFRDLFHFTAYHLGSIANCTRDVDFALRWGYAWSMGPFETWQAIGWETVSNWLTQDITAGNTMCKVALPEWVTSIAKQGVYYNNGAYAPSKKTYQPRSSLPVYEKQLFPEPIYGETFTSGNIIYETEAIKLWELNNDNIAILSFKTKMNTINSAVLDGIYTAILKAEAANLGLVIWQPGNHFSLGANLQDMLDSATNKQLHLTEQLLAKFHQVSLALRYAKIPTVAAVRGMALGGGCELMLHCARTIASFETNIGLVETGIGLIPAGGGCKEMALRAAQSINNLDCLLATIKVYFNNINTAAKSASAPMAQQLGYLRNLDTIIMNPYELLYTAKQQIKALVELGYKPPIAAPFPVAGTEGIAAITTELAKLKAKATITEHDYLVGTKLAQVICGGQVTAGTTVTEQDILKLERSCFIELLQSANTQARIAHTLATGKPLKN